jgi:hypothetical protein
MRCFAIALCLLLATTVECAARMTDEKYTPQSGQEGKDVQWLPTTQKLVDTMLDMANVTSSDYVIDLGSGDGRTVISAAKRGATALGIEYNAGLVEFARRTAVKEGLAERAAFEQADIFESDFSKATVITLFLPTALNVRLRPKILDMKPGTRIVSNTFDMGDWKADQTMVLAEQAIWNTAHLWIVPAKAHGSWKLSLLSSLCPFERSELQAKTAEISVPRHARTAEADDGQISFTQKFQNITGTLTMGEKKTKLSGKLAGDKISFTAGGTKYTGTVSGNTISGTRAGGDSWKAFR